MKTRAEELEIIKGIMYANDVDWTLNIQDDTLTYHKQYQLHKKIRDVLHQTRLDDLKTVEEIAWKIEHCAKVIIASMGDPVRTQIELEHLKEHILNLSTLHTNLTME